MRNDYASSKLFVISILPHILPLSILMIHPPQHLHNFLSTIIILYLDIPFYIFETCLTNSAFLSMHLNVSSSLLFVLFSLNPICSQLPTQSLFSNPSPPGTQELEQTTTCSGLLIFLKKSKSCFAWLFRSAGRSARETLVTFLVHQSVLLILVDCFPALLQDHSKRIITFLTEDCPLSAVSANIQLIHL